ncbi:hypothetical protein P691DRAFT_801947 [Macrolepiota fuliginosa MF-IS2]|uniref:Telomere-associated protein Rif1 N-terminal domain-containing protein n=1 Tax=Macrolepiota fuliginosa MF-IS2 TaxID=1400762 RepID=A0A9P5XP42_9AGAR|nr:hypothetical protein P691DRAFT_801947 [Macrolepiota fuliginosa MF-IS2]
MSLLTPPSSAHRTDKENRFHTTGQNQSRVVWSQHHQIHPFTTSPKPVKCLNANRNLPVKSILKQSSYPLLPLLDVKPREETPEPEDPLMDLHYLEGPVFTIISPLATMLELNEAYGRLMARLRTAVLSSTDADASWPLFQPIRQCKTEFVAALVRDLRRALENPADNFPNQAEDVPTECDPKATLCLPSPKLSPKKKKGMSAEQVKYARDLCTTSHSAMKFLALIMGLPAIYKLFTDTQLRELLTEVLAIPSADFLPTPNARKTCALAIWVIQVQRLSRSILHPLSIRIAHVIRRGIDGELGKEGKKGSASDGLKAIHDLSIFQPITFVPAFTNILDSILSNLLGPTLPLRQQACHALSGMVLGLVAIPRSSTSIHARISNIIADYITHIPASPRSTLLPPALSPSKLVQEAPIFRVFRKILNETEPVHVAQGPVWALAVLACFIVLLGPTVIHNNKIFRSLSTSLSLSMRHKKSSVRALGCMVWRCIAWVYFLPTNNTIRENSLALDMLKDKRDSIWRALMQVVDVQTGMAVIAAVLGDESIDQDDSLLRTMNVLENMLAKQTNVCDVIETMKRLVSLETTNTQWKVDKLLVPAIFASSPGLLTVEYKSLSVVVNDMLLAQPPLEDIRYLSRDEIAQEWVFDGMIKLWQQALANLKKFDEAEVSSMASDLMMVWQGLLSACGGCLQDAGDDDSMMELARKAADVLVDILEDASLDLVCSKPAQNTDAVADDGFNVHGKTNGELKLCVVSEMWRIAYMTFPETNLRRAGERLLRCLMKIEDELVESNDNARVLWVSLCIKALAVCDVDAMKMFWGFEAGGCEWDWSEEVRNIVWRTSVEKWSEDGCSWEGAAVLLAVPFTSPRAQILGNEDSKRWEDFLQYAFDKALDYGLDSIPILDAIADLIAQHEDLSSSASTQVADLLMSHLDMKEIREVPETLMEFVNNTMRITYPPELGNRDISRWMIRTLTNVIEHCPTALSSRLLELVQEGVHVWVADGHRIWSADDYEYEIVPLYAQALFCIQSLRPTMETLEKFTSVIESGFVGRRDKPQLVKDQFESFWNVAYGTWKTLPEEWPEGIQRCLGIDIETTIDDTSSSLPPSSPTLSVCDLPRPTTPPAIVLKTPKTPTTTLASRTSSPLQSHRIASAERGFLGFPPILFPSSPLRARTVTTSSPTTPKRAGKRAWGSGPASSITPKSKRRRVEEGEDKENASPRGPATMLNQIPSVAERMAMKSPLAASSSNRKVSSTLKRQLEREGGESSGEMVDRPSPVKKGRTNAKVGGRRSPSICSVGSDDSVEERDVASSLLQPSPCSQSSKRRMIMESVELPSFEEVLFKRRLRKTVSLESFSDSTAIKTPSTSGGRIIRKMRPSGKSTRKMSVVFDPFVSSSSPISALRLPSSVPGPTKLTRTASAPPAIALSSSSDDDPRYGQVTPHHLISPAPKKVLDVFDPPSDDSFPPSSPTKAVASRRSVKKRASVVS